MKTFFLMTILFSFSLPLFASESGTKEASGFAEKRQRNARKIQNNNFNVIQKMEERKNEQSNFGLEKKEKKTKKQKSSE